MKNLFFRLGWLFLSCLLFSIIILIIFMPIFTTNSLIFPYAITPFDICQKYPSIWTIIKKLYWICFFISYCIVYNFLYNNIQRYLSAKKFSAVSDNFSDTISKTNNIQLLAGINIDSNPIYISEAGLYQNILITGTIGSGKTSSAMYPFTKQLIKYSCSDPFNKLSLLILDVKGNYHKEVIKYATKYERLNDVILIDLSGKYKYNPLDKPHLKPIVLANRLKTILTLFSPNNSESYWLDKAEQILSECIKLCRLYNNNYVTFSELHKLIMFEDYYSEKLQSARKLFQEGKLDKEKIYDLLSTVEFFEKEFFSLDQRTLSILKSEISRITNIFISDYTVSKVFCPEKHEINFNGFYDVLKEGKIVVLNMNIAEYKNLSKIIAAYLKLDFQTEVMARLSKKDFIRKCAFISDEYHEYVTSTDSDFFAQSREGKCINIVATQSYTSLLNALKDESTTKVILQNLINKFWFRTDDIFTIEEAQKQIGKEDKEKFSTTISENAKETNFNFITNSLTSKDSSLSESYNTYTQFDYIYETNFFSQTLKTFESLAFLSNGFSIIKPTKLQMLPYFKQKEDFYEK